MQDRSEVLIAIMNNKRDFGILQDEGWYRIPVVSAPKRWPPKWLAFYQTKVFEDEAFAVRYYGRVSGIEVVDRKTLFPKEPPNPKSNRKYYQLRLERVDTLDNPITTNRPRRLVFIPTTWHKFIHAEKLNDLFDDSPLEDKLWGEFKRLEIGVERQWEFRSERKTLYRLDFALFCKKGFVDIETDGDYWHARKERIPLDNKRDNFLQSRGWHVLRFNGHQIRERMKKECIPRILETVNTLDGMSDEGLVPRIFYPSSKGIAQQLTLFESGAEYNLESA